MTSAGVEAPTNELGAPDPEQPSSVASYGKGARLLSIGIASTGLVTFGYFSLATYALGDAQADLLSVLWAVIFIIVSIIYRPIEQLLSRTIADRRARGFEHSAPIRKPLMLQGALALVFLAVALALRDPIVEALAGSQSLYWIFVASVIFYAASYFARGWLAGHQWFGLYGGLVFMEATARIMFAIAAVIGLSHGTTAVALGIAAAPLLSLFVVPLAFSRRPKQTSSKKGDDYERGGGGRFAAAVIAVMAAEQTLMNAAVLVVYLTLDDPGVATAVFVVLLVARAPLQLFQAIQGALLPHLAGLEATSGTAEFSRAIRVTVLAIAGFAVAVALGMLAIGPWAMSLLFDVEATFARFGLVLIALGMGAHLIAGTLNQAALARDAAGRAAAAWLLSAALFVAWMLIAAIEDAVLRTEVGYLGATVLLCALLALVYRRPPAPARVRVA